MTPSPREGCLLHPYLPLYRNQQGDLSIIWRCSPSSTSYPGDRRQQEVMTRELSIRLSLLSFFTTRTCWDSSSLVRFLFINIVWLLLLFHCCSWNCLCHDFSFPDLTSSTRIFGPSMVSKPFASPCTQMEGKGESWRGESLHLSFPGVNRYNFMRYLSRVLPTTKSDSTLHSQYVHVGLSNHISIFSKQETLFK